MTFRAKLVAKAYDFGGYITYVFENVEYSNAYDHYVMCTRFPNWQHADVNIGECGFVTCKEVFAGKDSWYDNETGSYIPYKYTGIHFLKFIKDNPDNKDIIL